MNADSKTQKNLYFYGQSCQSTYRKKYVDFMGMNRMLGYYNLHFCVYLIFFPNATVPDDHFPLEALFWKAMAMLVGLRK